MWNNRLFLSVLALFACCRIWSQSLFSSSERKAVGEVIASHIEQTVASLSAATDEEKAGRLATKKGIGIVIEGQQGIGARNAARQLKSQSSKEHKFYLAKGDKRISCRWAFEGGNSIIVMADISREAIEGTDKAQADSMMLETLANIPKSNYTKPIPEERQLSHVTRTSVLEHKGKSFMQSGMNSNTYYIKEKGKLQPVFSSKLPVESLHNLMANAKAVLKYNLDVSCAVYTTRTMPMRISLNDFVGYWMQHPNFNCYCGVEPKDNKTDYEVVFVIEHKELQYIHLLRFDFSTAYFDKNAPAIKANLIPNIPQHNIQSLF